MCIFHSNATQFGFSNNNDIETTKTTEPRYQKTTSRLRADSKKSGQRPTANGSEAGEPTASLPATCVSDRLRSCFFDVHKAKKTAFSLTFRLLDAFCTICAALFKTGAP
jgi:hypothetical protein